jgi:hemin uptake protein HemP
MTNKPPPPPTSEPTAAKQTRPRIDSASLFQGSSTVEIIHAGQSYLLRLTRENKLILTK